MPSYLKPRMAASSVVVSKDKDMLALGVREWLSVEDGGWMTGKAKLILLDELENKPNPTPSSAGVTAGCTQLSRFNKIQHLFQLIYSRS
mmetsp:Transcript_38238/g.49466  ORF Transcript_38238/g.49466 Transcript_38238/m.49466 type:complete len:89 (+) Transcript_38238:460-726(+)